MQRPSDPSGPRDSQVDGLLAGDCIGHGSSSGLAAPGVVVRFPSAGSSAGAVGTGETLAAGC